MRFEGIAKTNTTNTQAYASTKYSWFEGIAKTNTTNTHPRRNPPPRQFEGIAKTNTTNTIIGQLIFTMGLRVLLKQIQQTHIKIRTSIRASLRVLLKQIQQTHNADKSCKFDV